MSNSDNIPTFNDICGTVTEALAETIINRNNIIAGLREDLRIAQDLLRERCTNYNSLLNQNADILKENLELKKQVESLYTSLHRAEADHQNTLFRQRRTTRDDFGRGDAYWNAIRERDDARREYCEFVADVNREGYADHPDQTPQDVAKSMGWDLAFDNDTYTPSLFEKKSDSDPVTGVQYGDLV
jgi:hypothetical protein